MPVNKSRLFPLANYLRLSPGRSLLGACQRCSLSQYRTDTGASLAPWPAPKPQAARIMLFRGSTLGKRRGLQLDRGGVRSRLLDRRKPDFESRSLSGNAFEDNGTAVGENDMFDDG